jgi:hypothetical protein
MSKKKKNNNISTYNQWRTSPSLEEVAQRAETMHPSIIRDKPMPVAINLTKLRNRCYAEVTDFYGEGEVSFTASGAYIYKDNGSDILAIAHLDTVQSMKHFYTIDLGGERVVFNAQLDDRLGAYIILDLLPTLGVKCDILLTEGEESTKYRAVVRPTRRQGVQVDVPV